MTPLNSLWPRTKGKTIVVDIYADWCPTCRAQAPILEELRAERQSDDVLFVKVNFDDEKAFLREHRVPRQSTVLVFNGTTEVARSIAETNRTRLRSVVPRRALNPPNLLIRQRKYVG